MEASKFQESLEMNPTTPLHKDTLTFEINPTTPLHEDTLTFEMNPTTPLHEDTLTFEMNPTTLHKDTSNGHSPETPHQKVQRCTRNTPCKLPGCMICQTPTNHVFNLDKEPSIDESSSTPLPSINPSQIPTDHLILLFTHRFRTLIQQKNFEVIESTNILLQKTLKSNLDFHMYDCSALEAVYKTALDLLGTHVTTSSTKSDPLTNPGSSTKPDSTTKLGYPTKPDFSNAPESPTNLDPLSNPGSPTSPVKPDPPIVPNPPNEPGSPTKPGSSNSLVSPTYPNPPIEPDPPSNPGASTNPIEPDPPTYPNPLIEPDSMSNSGSYNQTRLTCFSNRSQPYY